MFDDVAKNLLKPGAVGIIPTDTVYGIVARVSDEAAIQKLYALKKREHKPGTVIAADIDQLVQMGVPRRYLTAVEQFWPGAVSVEIPYRTDYLNQGTGHLAFRIPNDKQLIALLKLTGPLQTTSANNPGAPPVSSLEEARVLFGTSVDFYVDGGDLSNREPSTVIRIIDDAIEVIRQGSVSITPNS